MCDGAHDHGGLNLCTDGYTKSEVCFLIGILHYNFNLFCTLREQNNKYQIYIRRKSIADLKKK